MSWLLGEHAVDYVKWDMNRELVPRHNGRAAADAQTRQFYRLLDVLGERFPLLNLNPAPPVADESITRC